MQDTDMPPHTHTCILYTCGSRELKTNIISEVKVEKMVIEVDFKCVTIVSFGGQGFAACPRVCGLGTRCVTGKD